MAKSWCLMLEWHPNLVLSKVRMSLNWYRSLPSPVCFNHNPSKLKLFNIPDFLLEETDKKDKGKWCNGHIFRMEAHILLNEKLLGLYIKKKCFCWSITWLLIVDIRVLRHLDYILGFNNSRQCYSTIPFAKC